MLSAILIAANMCLQGGEQIDISRYVDPRAIVFEMKVILKPAIGTLIVYSPGFEEQQVRFTGEESFGLIPFATPVLCVKAIGGPFEFNIEILPTEGGE
jgi:hypothetical protein